MPMQANAQQRWVQRLCCAWCNEFFYKQGLHRQLYCSVSCKQKMFWHRKTLKQRRAS